MSPAASPLPSPICTAIPVPPIRPPPTACARCGIRWVGVCAALDQGELGDLEAIMTHRRVDRGQSLLMEGDAAGFAYNVIGGGVKLFKSLPDGRTQITGFLLPGDFLGLPLRGAYAYSAEALADSVLCQFPRAALQAVFAKHPHLQARLLETVHDDLAAAQEHMLLLGRKNRGRAGVLVPAQPAEAGGAGARRGRSAAGAGAPPRNRRLSRPDHRDREPDLHRAAQGRADRDRQADEVSIRDRAGLAAIAAGG